MTVSRAESLRERIELEEILVLPGVTDALTAIQAEEAGFDAIYATGAGIANTSFGVPDVGLLTMTEIAERVSRIAESTNVPVIADADDGYGNGINVGRTVREFERAGVAGLQIEDQASPKRCGHFEDKTLIPLSRMLEKIAAFRRARRDPSLLLVARTDAIGVYGFDEAIRRGRAFARAGADVVFVEAPRTEEQLSEIPSLIPAPTLANMVEGGKTPLKSAAQLQEMGYSIALFANLTMRVAALAARNALISLKKSGDSSLLLEEMISWRQRQELVRLPQYQELEADLLEEAEKYAGESEDDTPREERG